MKKYRFSLATVLDVKRRREEVLVRQKASLDLLKSRVEIELKRWGGELAELFGQARKRRAAGRISVNDEELSLAREVDLKLRLAVERQKLLDLEKQIEAARLKLVEASKEKRILERLEERQWKEYLVAASREEQSFLDELAQHQYSQQMQQVY
jgi:flagellar protein FliJ